MQKGARGRGAQRHSKLPLWKLRKDQWEQYEEESATAVSAALEELDVGATPPERLATIQGALTAIVSPWLPCATQVSTVPGSGARSAESRVRVEVGRWECLRMVVCSRPHTHSCFQVATGRGGQESVRQGQKVAGGYAIERHNPGRETYGTAANLPEGAT